MLLKLIKTREFISGTHCEVWEVNPILGDRLLAEVYVLNEHLPLELIYRLTVNWRGICIHGKYCAWQWANCVVERMVTHYLELIQASREEIRIEVCRPKPDLPGYPEVDYHPDDYPVVFDNDLTMIQTTPLIEEGESCLHSPHHNHYVRSRRGPRLILIDDLDEDEKPEEPYEEPDYM